MAVTVTRIPLTSRTAWARMTARRLSEVLSGVANVYPNARVHMTNKELVICVDSEYEYRNG